MSDINGLKADLILAHSRIQALELALGIYADPSNWDSRQLSSKCAKVWTKRNQNGWEIAKTAMEEIK